MINENYYGIIISANRKNGHEYADADITDADITAKQDDYVSIDKDETEHPLSNNQNTEN